MVNYIGDDGSENQTNQRVPWGTIAKGAGIVLASVAAATIFYYVLSVSLEREERRENMVIKRNRELAGTVYRPNEPTIDKINQAMDLYKTQDTGKKTIDNHF